MPSAVELAAGDGDGGIAAQLGKFVIGVHVQWLLDPGDIIFCAGAGEVYRPFQVPKRRVVHKGHTPTLISVNANVHVLAHSIPNGLDLGDILRWIEAMHPKFNSVEAHLP